VGCRASSPRSRGSHDRIGYILTNHTISLLTEVNDLLLNSLSVTTPGLIEALHWNCGYHVEHHVFPAMSPRHAPRVRDALRERWPDRYQSLPISTALWRIFTSSRVYKDAWTLIDPHSGREFPTLSPRVTGQPARVPVSPV
jgi:fatty acid desaturase